MRHVYDLHTTRGHYDAAEVAALIHEIILTDVEAYGHQFPAYRDDPVGETLRAVRLLAGDLNFATRHDAFLRDMVYGGAVEFEIAIATVSELASLL